ncbi:methylmalonyl Co-A mutase-associated GTPase MeaB [Baekduia soli]|uniref:Methylmalonyl Co-A mutase-associated GTPase MeaB n=1 Tax=Baekduia soli TaxID=496014 RepID=A0A5B8U0R8_9ACTN|nr:methylmalonyl Co-A mutase-associated GTPase MeaB [Baekduia soli]QEC46530.1 methylmalonyl Co-A mutase-associated GTPase MeaB [Baekduia soli]
MTAPVPQDLLDAARDGRTAPLGRLVSLVERGGPAARDVARAAYPLSGAAYTVGITGAPGAGKSTLTGRLVGALRSREDRVAVLAVDPSSPYSGGAILGDRVRMHDHVLDDGVFIRSMATRGHLGGLSLAAPEAVRVLDAAGYDWVLLETVGVGQVELDVTQTVDTTIVVVNPGWGDDVQAAKAGLLEIADVLVVNKADRPGLDETRMDLENMLDTSTTAGDGWRPPVVATVAADGGGVDDLLTAIEGHRAWLAGEDRLAAARAARLWDEVESILAARLRRRAQRMLTDDGIASVRSRVGARDLDPWSASDRILAALDGGAPPAPSDPGA